MRYVKGNKGQTAVELAVFGAILIFVIGSTIRATVSRSMQQNMMLRSMRLAMTLSYTTTEEDTIAGRNTAMVVLVEDRLSPASTKYGSLDRTPMILQGSGSHSRHMMMPVDFGDSEDLPLFDMFVNGKHFVFSTAGFKYVRLAHSCAGQASCPADCKGDCTASSLQYFRGKAADGELDGGIPVIGIPDGDEYWEPNCFNNKITTTQYMSCADAASVCPDPACEDCSPASTELYEQETTSSAVSGCPKLYTIVQNHPLVADWCEAGCLENLSANERFDLDRNELDGIAGDVVVPVEERGAFSWQWFLVFPIQEGFSQSLNYDPYALRGSPVGATETRGQADLAAGGEGIVLPGGDDDAKNVELDVDRDLKLEYILPNVEENDVQPNQVDNNGVITRMGVMDPQEGDLDMTWNDLDEAKKEADIGPAPFGFLKDLNLYAFVRADKPGGGTYFKIDEGHLYSTDGQFIRNTSRKDQVDLIERIFRFSNNTGGYCYADPPNSGPPYTRRNNESYRSFYAIPDSDTPNPVEACVSTSIECFSGENINRTCMAVDNRLIFIRSRIQDLRGHQWITDRGQDPSIDFGF